MPDKPASPADDATLPPPRELHAAGAAAGSTAPPGAPPTLAVAPDGAPTLALPTDPDATLPPPTLPPPEVFSPTDATLDPNDPRVQAFHAAAQKTSRGPTIATGASFGDYHLIEPIAKGGMGIVYKAKQRKLNRIVAIKMILAGQFADQADIDRFYAEAEAAAALSHPNIVAIHEVGEFDGQHFFSMDFIDGQSLSDLVRENPLPARRAAEIVRTLAETMQYAHDNGIVHRDLKPSNVLLDKKQRPLITDFGLAKQVTNQSQLTMAGAVVGTPSYMPPEQAAGKSDEVGPWSDLYSLGAILYELVTGRPPFQAATPFETIRQVLEAEPLSPRLLNPGIPKDLETICLKCLQKARTNRYASAQELADELGRFLRGEPIQARPISQLARFWRLCRRYPITSAAIAAAVLMLVTVAGVSSAAYVLTAAAKRQSDQSFRDAMQAVNEMFTVVSEETLLNQPGMQPLREKLLNKAKEYFERFLTQRADDPQVAVELAGTYYRLGRIAMLLQSPDDAVAPYQSARAIQERLAAGRSATASHLAALGDTLNALGEVWAKKKDFEAARREYLEAARLRERLVALDGASAEYQRALANSYMNLGLAARYMGDRAEARRQFERAQSIRQAAIAQHPNDRKLRRDLGQGYYNLGDLDRVDERAADMETHLKSAIQVFEALAADEPNNLETQMLLAVSYRALCFLLQLDRPDEARLRFQQAIDRLQPLAEQNPAVIDYQVERATLLHDLALLEFGADNGPAARRALLQARDILRRVADRFPAVPRYQRELAAVLRDLAIEHSAAGEAQAAQEHLRQALDLLGQLVQRYPNDAELAEQLADTQSALGPPTAEPRK